jgi:hypothetical protein
MVKIGVLSQISARFSFFWMSARHSASVARNADAVVSSAVFEQAEEFPT